MRAVTTDPIPGLELGPDSLLEVAPGSTLRLAPSEEVILELGDGRSVRSGAWTLAILDAFARPRTLADGLAELQGRIRGVQDFTELIDAVRWLARHGVLRLDGEGRDGAIEPRSWANPSVHLAMLNDRGRTDSFLRAIREVVHDGDVVVDVGTGTGVLAVAAVRAGARRVYAVEASEVAEVARRVFELNGVADRVVLVEGWSTRIDPPERADVLVSETIGSEPLEEHLLELVGDARRRLLVPQPRLVPGTIRLIAHLLRLDLRDEQRHTLADTTLARWQGWYGIDLSPIRGALGARRIPSMLGAKRVGGFGRAGASAVVVEIDLLRSEGFLVEGEAIVQVRDRGPIHGVAITFEAELGPTTTLTVDPWTSPDTHWAIPVWWAGEPLHAEARREIVVRYCYRVPGEPDGLTFGFA
jgi:hypothetical protein